MHPSCSSRTIIKPLITIYGAKKVPSPELGAWLNPFDWQWQHKLSALKKWLVMHVQTPLIIDFSDRPQAALADLRQICCEYPQLCVIALVRTDQQYWGQEAVRLGAHSYVMPNLCTAEALAMMLESLALKKNTQQQSLTKIDHATRSLSTEIFFDRLSHGLDIAKRLRTSTGLLLLEMTLKKHGAKKVELTNTDSIINSLQEQIRKSDSITIIGKNQFAILLEDVKDDISIGHIAQKIEQTLVGEGRLVKQPIDKLFMGAHFCHCGDQSAQMLFSQLQSALLRSKNSGHSSLWFYSQTQQFKYKTRKTLEQSLDKAIQQFELRVCCKPLTNVDSNKICGTSISLGWPKKSAGSLNPNEFETLLYSSGLMCKSDPWMFEQVCQHIQVLRKDGNWSHEHIAQLPICLAQLRSDIYKATIKRCLKQYDISSKAIVFKVQHDIAIKHSKWIKAFADELAGVHFSVTLDSLNDARQFINSAEGMPYCSIELSEAFLNLLNGSSCEANMAQLMVNAAKAVGIKTLIAQCDELSKETIPIWIDKAQPMVSSDATHRVN